jgi:heme exporter protein C
MFKYANPALFMRVSGALLPYVSGACIIAFAIGLFLAFRVPPDYQQGMTVLIL